MFLFLTGGHFVCKLFDLFTPFSVGLIYLMYHAFEKVCIFKPNTSRPANSERYVKQFSFFLFISIYVLLINEQIYPPPNN